MTDFVLDGDRLPWEKQSGETMNAFTSFAAFRDLGSARTLPKCAEATGKSVSHLQTWSSRYRWFERAEQYDLAVDARHREQQETIREQILEAHRFAGQLGVNAVIERLQGRQPGSRGPDDPGLAPLDPAKMDWTDVPRVLGESVRTQRLAMGEPTDFVKGVLNLSPSQAQKIVLDVFEMVIKYVPVERQPIAAAEVDAYFERGGEESGPRALTAG